MLKTKSSGKLAQRTGHTATSHIQNRVGSRDGKRETRTNRAAREAVNSK